MPAPKKYETLLTTPELPELGPGPRRGVQPLAALRRVLDGAFAGQPLVQAMVLLWHDHFDAAHELCQKVETSDGSWVHGILHRREPDYGNARYWFHRVGRHEAFPELARRAGQLLQARAGHPPALDRLVAGGTWDPLAFVAACESVQRAGEAVPMLLLRELQAAEFSVLLEHLCARNSAG